MVTRIGGGHTLVDALRLWWYYAASSMVTVVTILLAPFILAGSLVYWPYYCRWVLRPSRPTIAATSVIPNPPSGS